ncbi:MAG: pentapeptide repeat-containing protein [Micavibrio aeruginosavorus]|uniref:Pentapeptide repeat-containing protein n=1 Tax=Micavibrio aeruginosavorus TaxID=349221 RepID=A0A7T5UHZ6_9BACT|nr:MAG: pentapeptide repeat-containing protein [Micavibrio aeruginosavorus]
MLPSAPDTGSGLEKITQRELDDIITKHTTFLKGIRGGARAVLKFKDLSHLDFHGGNLSQGDFTGSVLNSANLSHGTFKGVSFFACDLRNANLEKADFSRADFRGAYVAGANLEGANLKSADMREGRLMERDDKGQMVDMPRSHIPANKGHKTIFTGAKLSETNLSGARASAADFSDADLSGVIVVGADFSGANLEGANLTNADFTGSDLSNSNLRSSIMSGTILQQVETGGANLREAITEESMGTKIEELDKTLPELLEEHTAWVATAGRTGRRLDLSGFDLRTVPNLRHYSLTAVKAVGANFLRQNLESLEMQSALLDRADFRDTQMRRADLRGSTLKNAMIARADLSEANLSPLQFTHEDGGKWLQRTNLSGSNLRYAVLRGTNLTDAILMGVDLSYAVLIDCDLRRADLTGAILDGADLSGALLTGAILDARYRK